MKLPAVSALALAAAALPASAINICTNENGVKSYQDEPCTTKAPSPALAPVKAESLDERSARETMRRYETALSTRDPVAVARLVSTEFVVNLKMLDKPPKKINYWEYTEMIKLVLNAYPHYKARHQCKGGKPTLPASVVLECVTDEEIRAQGKLMGGTANETFHFILEGGQVKIRQLDSIQLTGMKQR